MNVNNTGSGLPVQAVLFDLDGTLLDTLDDIADSANFALGRLGFPTHPTEAYRHFVGDGMRVLLTRVLPEDMRTSDKIAEITKIYSEHYTLHSLDKTKPYKGAPEMLKALKEISAFPPKLAVISNKPDAQAQKTIEHFFGRGTFDYSSGGIDGVPLKPHPAMALRALNAMCVLPERSVFVGDSGMDMKTAKSAGCRAVGVTWGFREADELTLNGADLLISAPSELISLISGFYDEGVTSS